nr:MAG TPA: hypothetical protein [Caudoviricetes sp.]
MVARARRSHRTRFRLRPWYPRITNHGTYYRSPY